MQADSAHTSPPPGASSAAINAQDASMKGPDVLQISLVEMLARNPALRFDWDRKTFSIEFNLNDANGPVGAINDAPQCIQNLCGIPDGTPRQTILVQAATNGAGNDNTAQPRPCEIHEAQTLRGSAVVAGSGGSTSKDTPRCTRPLPRRNQIVNGCGQGAPATIPPNPNPNTNTNVNPGATQAGATYDNTNTPPTSSDNANANDGDADADDDDVPLDVLKREGAVKRKRKAAAAAFEPVVKTEPVEKECGKRLHPERCQFKIRGIDEHVRWYYTESKRPIDAVPAALLKPTHEALYVHRFNVPFVGWQAWMYIKKPKSKSKSKSSTAGRRAQANVSAGAGDGAAGSTGSRVGNLGGNGNGSRKKDRNGDGNRTRDGNEREGGSRERSTGEWRRMEIGEPHPRLAGLVLHMLDEDGPRWVKPQSARTYANGKNKRARWARYA